MTDSMNCTMVRTIVKKAIRDIKTDPERTTRNLIDMALNFADSCFRSNSIPALKAFCPMKTAVTMRW